MKEELMRNWTTRMCALILKDGLKRIAKKMDYSEHEGAIDYICKEIVSEVDVSGT